MKVQKIDNSKNKKLISLVYLSYSLGFGPFISLAILLSFHKNKFIAIQLIQAFLIQFLAYSIILALTVSQVTYSQINSTPNHFLFNSVIPFSLAFLEPVFRITFIILSLIIINKNLPRLPLFYKLADLIYEFFGKKSIKKAKIFNSLLAGFGNIFLNQKVLGLVLLFAHFIILISLFSLVLAYFNFPFAKNILTSLGFYFRVGDKYFVENFINLNTIISLSLLLLFNCIISIFALPKNLDIFSEQDNINNEKKLFLGSLSLSYSLNLGIFWALLLLPFIFSKSEVQKSIKNEAEKVYEKLSEQKKQKETKQNTNPKQIEKNNKELTKELNFDLQLSNEIDGLNEFSDKKFSPAIKPIPKPEISFNKGNRPLPEKKNYIKEYSRKTKSYSEYITAKVRENERDELVWQKAPKPYSTVMRYKVSVDGIISDIEIVEPSNDLKTDSIVISVIESMNPLLKPKNGKPYLITELFWNTQGKADLDTDLKIKLSQYPDGRVIEEL